MSDPRTPRPSDGWNAARRPGGATPGQPAQPAPADPLESLFDAFARSTDITPAPDLTRRIHAAISREPARTPPRRFIVALFGLKLAAARDAFAQTAGVAFGKGRFSALVRAQALALVALTLGVVGLAAVGGAIGLRQVVDRFDVDDQAPTELIASPSPSTLPSLFASPSPSPDAPSPSPSVVPSASPSAEPTESPDPTEEATDDPTADPTKDGGVEPRRTQEPGDGGDKETPRPTQKPRATAKPTPRPTREPRETEKPEKTPKPTKKPTPEPEDTDKPDETDEPEDTQEPADDNGGGNSGPGSAGQAWSGGVVAVGPVLLVITI